MFKLLFYSDLNTGQALERIEAEVASSPDREELLSFVRSSKRGISRKLAGPWDAESE
jgi:UDP-N-acetylglucosamine acyltransferase